MATKINTSAYSENFGRNPRPNDYALWVFILGRDSEFYWNGTYATASRLAKAEAKKLGFQSIRIAR